MRRPLSQEVFNKTMRGAAACAFAFFLAVGILCGGAPAQAQLTVNAVFGNSITSDTNAAAIQGAINNAVAVYNSNLTTNTPVTVNIAFGEMGSGLGQSLSFFGVTSYSSFLTQLNTTEFPFVICG